MGGEWPETQNTLPRRRGGWAGEIEGEGGRELLEAAPGTKNPSSALYFLPKLERPHFHQGLHSGQFRCTLQRPQMGGVQFLVLFLK